MSLHPFDHKGCLVAKPNCSNDEFLKKNYNNEISCHQ
jgi:hypothetical protein